MRRNMQFEHAVMTASTLDRKAANDIYKPNSFNRNVHICNPDQIVTSDGRLKIHQSKTYEAHGSAIMAEMELSTFTQTAQACNNIITELQGGTDVIVNNHSSLHSRFPALRFSRYPNLASFYQTVSVNDFSYASQLANDLQIQTGWDHSYRRQDDKWNPVMKLMSDSETYKIYDVNGTCKAQFIIVKDYINSWYSVLPVTAFRNLDFSTEFITFTPPGSPYAFLNEHLLYHFPDAPIVLTPDIELALRTWPSDNAVVLANIGHDHWLDGLNYSTLKGRRIVLIDDGQMHPEYTIQFLEKLSQQQISAEVESSHVNFINGHLYR